MTTLSRVPRSSAVVAVLLAVTLVAGCGGSAEPRTLDRSPSPTTSSPKPAKVQTIRLSKHGFSFELPAGWSKIDREGAVNAQSPVMKNIAQHLGMSAERLVQLIETSVEVLAVTDQGADSGFLENVNVVPLPAGQATESQLRLQIAAVAGKTSSTRKVTTPIGQGVTISYTLSSAGNVVQGAALAIGTSADDQVLITVSAHRASDAADRLEQIITSLDKLG